MDGRDEKYLKRSGGVFYSLGRFSIFHLAAGSSSSAEPEPSILVLHLLLQLRFIRRGLLRGSVTELVLLHFSSDGRFFYISSSSSSLNRVTERCSGPNLQNYRVQRMPISSPAQSFISLNLPPYLGSKKNVRKFKPLLAKKGNLNDDLDRQQPVFPLKISRAFLARSAVVLFGLGFIDAGSFLFKSDPHWKLIAFYCPFSNRKEVTVAYNKDPSPIKLNLGVGAYRTEEGKPLVLNVVRRAEQILVNDRSQVKEYLPITGLADFNKSSAKLIFGADRTALTCLGISIKKELRLW